MGSELEYGDGQAGHGCGAWLVLGGMACLQVGIGIFLNCKLMFLI